MLIENKIQSIKERLLRAMRKNDALPEHEKIQKEDFVIDFSEKKRLLEESDKRIQSVRSEIELDNLKKRVICNRIKVHSKNEFNFNEINVVFRFIRKNVGIQWM